MGYVPLSALGLREAIFEDDADRDDSVGGPLFRSEGTAFFQYSLPMYCPGISEVYSFG